MNTETDWQSCLKTAQPAPLELLHRCTAAPLAKWLERRIQPWAVIQRGLAWLLLALLMASCATQSKLVFHGIQFEMGYSQNSELIFFRYERSGEIIEQVPRKNYDPIHPIPQGTGTSGYKPIGDQIYVKWRDTRTAKIHEETKSLIGKLPSEMHMHDITFIIRDNKLIVYVVTPLPRIKEESYDGPSLYRSNKVIKLN